ncbi:MAG: tyrosine-type recombinase/integrase [Calothrix sp. FI2-JRJ7]|jgi:integrase/recombinase XerD|nr:tyrosine-type recombinase/integrase [Calothrix sp. FI2-JRJ7]
MSRFRAVPDPVIIQVNHEAPTPINKVKDLRELRIDEFLAARNLAPKSEKAYRKDLKYFLEWCDTSWVEVEPRQIANFKLYLQRKSETKCALKEASVRRVLGTLKNFYNWMFRSGYVKSDPTLAVDLPKVKEPGANNLSEKIVADIFGAVEKTNYPERNLAIVGVLLHGLRASEVCSLNFGDYDGECLEVRIAKSGSVGTVPLEQWCLDLVENYLDWRREELDFIDETNEAPLFISCSRSNKGGRIGYNTISKLCHQLKKETGHDFHAHQFRHTFGTNLILAGINPYHAMTLMRHKSVSNFRRYAKAADKKAAIKEFHGVSQKGSILRPEL